MKIEDLLAKSSEEIAALPAQKQREILRLIEEYQEAQAIEAARTDFMAFVRYIWPEFIEGPHHKIVADILNKIQRGELNRAITNMAPRMTKSELHSWLYPAWRMGLSPTMKIIQCSHSAELAEGFGRRVRDLIQTKEFKKVFPECRLSSNSGAAHRWATDKGGTYFAIGVDGKLAGKGADLLIIDDPHAEAESVYGTDTGFERVYNWYKAGPRQRLQPGAAIIVCMTRWSKLDLTGQLVSSMSKRGGESWHVTEFPAILHENTPEEKSIWPEYWPLEELKATKNEVGHVAWAAQYQQALALDTPIPTPDGWSTIGNLRPGDFVIGADGRPTEVLWKSKVYKNRPTFFVQTDDGACVEADADHLWSVDLGRESKGEVVRTTQELFDRQEARKKLLTAPRRPKIKDALRWSLPDVSLPLDPYLLGAWLGDGTAASSYFTSSDEDAPHWAESFSAAGFEFVKYSKPYSYNVKGLAKHLRAAGVLGNKHVPEKYLRASAEQRLALLQGLMDTDGHCSRGQAQFANTNTRIVKAVEELVLSLGAKPCTTSFVPPKGKRCYKVCFYMEDAFRLPRKRKHCRNKKSKHGRFVSIKQAGFSDTACIRVAAEDQLFLAGKKCLVTHNCPTSREAVIISRDKWNIWEDRDPPPCDYVIQTWDTAHEKGNRNDPSAMQTWGVFHLTDENTGIAKPNIILLDAFKKRMHFPELKRQCLEEYRRSDPDSVLVEGRASGKSLVQELRSMGLPIVEYTVGRGTAKMPNDKISRVNSVSDIFESGLVWAPETRFAEEVMDEIADFPAGEHDDYVDCMVMALRRFRDGGFIRLDNDYEPEPLQRRRAAYY